MPFIPAMPLLVIYSIEAQLTLEQYGFEVCGPTYMWVFFPTINTVVVNNLRLVESADTEELRI